MMKHRPLIIAIAILAVLMVSCQKADTTPSNTNQLNGHYSLPVIFHVLYVNDADPLQYVPTSRISEIVDEVNRIYRDKVNSVDMNLSFSLAKTDPQGRTMTTPGVEYINCTGISYPMDCREFMTDEKAKGGVGYVNYIWDPNDYINIFLFNFSQDPAAGFTILGLSHMPYSPAGKNYLEGLSPVPVSSLDMSELTYPYSASINSLFINKQSTAKEYRSDDVNVTIAHELGHYLGLDHVFFSEDDTKVNRYDPDYCPDTESYNKNEYDRWFLQAVTQPGYNNVEYLARRTDINNIPFVSHNIMDYSVSYADKFTPNQLARVRHVLNYSPLIPGPKVNGRSRAATNRAPLELPIVVIE